MANRFQTIMQAVTALPDKQACALVCPDGPSLEAAREAERLGLIDLLLFPAQPQAQDAAAKAVQAVRRGDCQMILKGNIDTAILLKEVVNKDYGLASGRLISHVALLDLPSYHKMILLTDGGMVMYPDLDQLRGILENALPVMHKLGLSLPKVACLAAVEKAHERMPETMRALALKTMNQRGDLTGCLLEGPISFDLAFSREAAKIKAYDSPVAGDADIFLVPDFVSGNLLAKSLVYGGGASFAGFLMGARSPVILTSRSASIEEKIHSIACGALMSEQEKEF
ncbi:MAG: phosphate butyryltransferase [Clostridiaceae bacterium]|jgi:phosphate butyryltransferase|nr:phosphate butyryltransferase [Clostridiaceae bacterium]